MHVITNVMSIIQYLHCMMGILCITDVNYGVCCCCLTAAPLVGQGLRRLGISRDVSPLPSCHAAAFSGDNRVMSCTFASTSDEQFTSRRQTWMFRERWRESAAYHTVVSWKFKIRDKTEVANRQSSSKFKVNRNLKFTSFSFTPDLTSYLFLTSILVRKKRQ